jgi:hypothetical protein
VGGSINDGFVRWACVYAAKRWLCAGAIFAVYFIFLNGESVVNRWIGDMKNGCYVEMRFVIK